MPDRFTLYTAKVCPFAQRVELALAEVNADYTSYQIDLKNKPEWYAPKVNPASKVPAVAYGGPDVPPDQPSPESHKIAESLILLEFVADLYPISNLLPQDPVQRAKVRFFIDAISNKVVPIWGARDTKSPEEVLSAFKVLNDLLPREGEGRYAIGNHFTNADAAILPFLARAEVTYSNDLGTYAVGEGKKAWDKFQTDPGFARVKKYFEDLKARESFKATFDTEYIKDKLHVRYNR